MLVAAVLLATSVALVGPGGMRSLLWPLGVSDAAGVGPMGVGADRGTASVPGGVLVGAAEPASAGATAIGTAKTVRAVTSTGRRGAYYLPRDSEARALPLMVFFHGSGGKGALAILRLQALAEREGFIALAPDSVSVSGVWWGGQRPAEATADQQHAMACVREVLGTPGVRVDPARVLAAGFSVGGAAAASVATREAVFTAFAVLHGHFAPASIGPRRPRAWFSTGDRDRSRPVEPVKRAADDLRRLGFADVEVRVFRADHSLEDVELTALVAWWLGRPVGRG